MFHHVFLKNVHALPLMLQRFKENESCIATVTNRPQPWQVHPGDSDQWLLQSTVGTCTTVWWEWRGQ